MPFLERADAPKLYYQEDRVDSPIGDALLVHGFGDHCGRYDAFTESLNGLGLNLLRYDYRGHGRSEGRVGDFDGFQDYLDDLQVFWEQLRAGAAERPCFLLGHSNGGLIAFTAAAKGLEGCAGLVLSSPFFGLKMPIPLWKRAALKVLNASISGLRLPSDLNPSWMSHDPAVVKGYDTDPLIGRLVSTRWFLKTTEAQRSAPQLAAQLKTPTLFQIAGDDKIANPRDAERIYQQIENAQRHWCEYPSLYHEIWFEAEDDRAQVIGDLTSWLQSQLESEDESDHPPPNGQDKVAHSGSDVDEAPQ